MSSLTASEEIALLITALERSGSVDLTANGRCMRPWADDGDTLIIEPLPSGNWKGRILLTRSGDTLFAHRVLEIRDNGDVRTKGDLHPGAGDWFERVNIIGEVVAIRRGSRTISLRTPWTRWLARLTGPAMRAILRLRRPV